MVALAAYFHKAALGASALMAGVSVEAFSQLVSPLSVTIRFGSDAVQSPEGRVSLELLTNLLARFYPTLSFDGVGDAADKFGKKLADLTMKSNPLIAFSTSQPPYFSVGTIT